MAEHLIDTFRSGRRRAVVLAGAALVFVLPILHPLLRPTIGVPSHLLWFVHVLPVTVLAYLLGAHGAAAGTALSVLWVVVGETLFGAGYGHGSDWVTRLALAIAVAFTDLLAAGFVLWIRAEEVEHEDATRQLRAGLDASMDATLMLDASRRIGYANAAARALFGTRPGELAGKLFDDLLIGGAGESPVLQAAEGRPVEVVTRAAARRPVAAELAAAPVRADGGRSTAYLVTVRDQSERLRSEQAMRRTQALSELGAVIASVAHDLNNPLAAVASFADVVSQTPGLPEDAREGIDIMTREARRAAGIARQLLSLVRAGERPQQMVDLAALVQQALKARGRSFAAHGIEVVARAAGLRPKVRAVPGEIEQVLSNLLANAEQAMYAAHGAGRLTVSIRSGEGSVEVGVADDGPGIAAENMARVFEAFFTSKPVGSGTGLGLSTARRIARDHGGDLTVASAPGRGAAFTLRLPLAAEPAAEPAPAPTAADIRLETTRGARVLALDDEPSILRAIHLLLSRRGHSVTTAGDGAGAVAALEAGDFDLVLCDIHLGETDGIELYRKTVARRPEYGPRFVFLTGDVMGADLRQVCATSGCGHLVKPFETEELLAVVARALAA